MDKYIIEQKKKCGLRVKQIRKTLGYTEAEFGKLINLSENTIINIESGGGFNSNSISLISFFTGISLTNLFDYNTLIHDTELLKNTFKKNVKKYNSDVWEKISNPTLTIKSIILILCKNSKYFNIPRKVSEVKSYIEDEFQKKTSSSVISQALVNAYNNKTLKRTKSGLRNYLYHI